MDYSVSFGSFPEFSNATVTALGGIPKELINHRNYCSYSS